MTSFLILVSKIYKYAFLLVLAVTIFMMIVGSDPAAVTFGKGIGVLAYPFMFIFNHIMMPLAEWIMSLYEHVSNMSYEQENAIGGFGYFIMLMGSALISLAGVLTVFAYFPVVFLMFPIWTIFDEDIAKIWVMFFDPLQVFGEVVVPLMAEMQNLNDMNSSNETIRQMAVNDDLADRIVGKMPTKQDVVDAMTNRNKSR